MKSINRTYDGASEGEIIFLPKVGRRIYNQKGIFTYHELPQDFEDGGFIPFNKREKLPSNVAGLKKHTIDRDAKKKILYELNKLGINYSFIFPDLEGLALSIKRDTIFSLQKLFFDYG